MRGTRSVSHRGARHISGEELIGKEIEENNHYGGCWKVLGFLQGTKHGGSRIFY